MFADLIGKIMEVYVLRNFFWLCGQPTKYKGKLR